MGVSVSYWTTHRVDDDIKAMVRSDSERVAGSYSWWCEELSFFEWPGKEEQLTGDTKLLRLSHERSNGEEVEIDPHDDEFMMLRDLSFIVDQLRRWSAEYQLQWEVTLAGETIGTIEDGEPDNALSNWLHETSAAVGMSEDKNDVDARAAEICGRYAD